MKKQDIKKEKKITIKKRTIVKVAEGNVRGCDLFFC